MATLKDEIKAYERLRPELEAAHTGEWAVVHNRKLISTFKDFQTAANEAVSRFGRGPFLIRQIGIDPGPLPASIFLGSARDANKLRL